MHIHLSAYRDKLNVLSSLCGSSGQGSFRDFAQSHVFSRASIRVVRARVGDGACRRYPCINGRVFRRVCAGAKAFFTRAHRLLIYATTAYIAGCHGSETDGDLLRYTSAVFKKTMTVYIHSNIAVSSRSNLQTLCDIFSDVTVGQQ
jgi:hypothetical protein